ncbi:MAG: ribonuclease III [Propionibacteriaceae bacterium]|jgi:ribonuclease-3|nr:ribonuclease III [Propionibacteriaceae bacterium]
MSAFFQLLTELDVHIEPELFDLALTHRSYAYEHGQIPNNERLEFLGDAVLSIVVTERLYRAYPDFPEGRLAKLRAAVVSSVSLAAVARRLEIGSLIKLGKGEISTHGDDKTSILADTVEALIGAAYLSDASAARRLVTAVFQPLLEEAVKLGSGLDWKTALQELTAANGLGSVGYQLSETGPDHDKEFTARAVINERSFEPGVGHNKKHAEQIAAENAARTLQAEGYQFAN